MYTDLEEMREVQEKRIEYFKKKMTDTSRKTEEEQRSQLTLVLQARAKMSEHKVNGPKDAFVSEMIKQLPYREDLQCYEVFSGTLHGSDGGSEFMEDCETGVLAETRCGTEERCQRLQGHSADIGDVQVVRVLY